MFPVIIAVCLIGSYSIRNNVFDVVLVTVFGVIGYLAWKLRLEFAPFVLALLLGPIMENSLRQALLTTRGDFSIFVTRPVSAICLLAVVAIVLVQAIPAVRKTRQALPTDDT
jgi:TctA family transporter